MTNTEEHDPVVDESAEDSAAVADVATAEDEAGEDEASGVPHGEAADSEEAASQGGSAEGESAGGESAGGGDDADEPVEPPAPVDPKLWYVLKVQSNRERTIRDSLLKRIRLEDLEEFFGDIVIPTEKVAETKGGKKRVVNRKLFPGYMMIQMELNDDTWYLVRDTSGVGDFTGAAGKPIPMQQHEIDAMLGKRESSESEEVQPKVKITVSTGETVKINDGPLESFEGVVESVDEASGKIQVLVQILGQSTPVELEYWQVETI